MENFLDKRALLNLGLNIILLELELNINTVLPRTRIKNRRILSYKPKHSNNDYIPSYLSIANNKVNWLIRELFPSTPCKYPSIEISDNQKEKKLISILWDTSFLTYIKSTSVTLNSGWKINNKLRSIEHYHSSKPPLKKSNIDEAIIIARDYLNNETSLPEIFKNKKELVVSGKLINKGKRIKFKLDKDFEFWLSCFKSSKNFKLYV